MKTTSAILDPFRTSIDEKSTDLTRARYQRISTIYDRIESLMERRFQPWREKLWQFVCGPRVLEVGVGTGKNIRFWPLNCFNTVVATFVFFSVPDPVQGLREIGRVVRPGGQILLLEHVRIDQPIIGTIMDYVAPLIVRINGANINRRTVENVRAAGLQIDRVHDLDDMGMFKMIFARPRSATNAL